MTLKLDIRGPIIVLVADFNPAIFQPPWIAKHLFGRGVGEQMALAEVLIQNGPVLTPLVFLDSVAINVTGNRTELFALNAEQKTLECVEAVLLKMLETLPHTPLSAIGCNLSYIDDSPNDMIVDLFKTPEGFEAEGALNFRQSGVQLQLDDGEILNFSRVLGPNEVRYSFNYHRTEGNSERYKEFVPNMTDKALSHSKKLLQSLYGYDSHDVIGFVVEAEQEGDDGDAQTAN
jgi:hypothetical protein